jgi:outer membrane protein assembly factor BamD
MRRLILIALAAVALASCAKKVAPLAAPFDPARDLKKANEKLESNYGEAARRLLENIIRLDATGEYAPLAQLRLADSYVKEDLPDLAVEEYREFLRTYPRHKYASYAQYQIGLAYYGLIRGPDRGFGFAMKSLAAFERLNAEYPRNPYRQEASLKIEQCRAIMADHEYRVGQFYYKKDACRGAVGRFEGIRKDFPGYSGMARLLYQLAVCYEKLGMPDKSKAALDEMATLFPASGYSQRAAEEIQEYREDAARRAR